MEAANEVADAEINKLLFVGLGAPALAGAGAALAPAAGALAGEQVVGAIGSRIAYYATSASVGSATNVALEAGKNVSFGADGTAGSYIGAAASGALGGAGIKLLGGAVPSDVNNIALGATTGLGGEFIAQALDVSSGKAAGINVGNLGAATVIGAGASAVTPLEVRVGGLNAGRNNSVAIHTGLQTRLDNGGIAGHQLRYSVEGRVGTAVTGAGQGALGAAATGVYKRVQRKVSNSGLLAAMADLDRATAYATNNPLADPQVRALFGRFL